MANSNQDDEHERPPLTILYATETGTAQDIADRVARHCRVLRLQCNVHDVADYPLENIVDEQLVVFVVSTVGSGKEPRPMTSLWEMLLRADLPTDLFEDLHYAIFGLGDSSYERFCWPAKKLGRRLDMLGATAICPRAEGDVQHSLGTDGALEPWLDTLVDSLKKLYPPPLRGLIWPILEPWPARVAFTPSTAEALEKAPDPILDAGRYYDFTVRKNTRITSEDWFQDVRHCELRCADDIAYEPGDVAVIHPTVQSSDVDALLQSQSWTDIADEPFGIEHRHRDQFLPPLLPRVTTIRDIVTRHVDITAIPKRSFFALLRHFTDDEREREKMNEFVSKEGVDDLYDYTTRVRRSIVEVLDDFPHVKIPKEYVFDIFPPLRPREFSIASSVMRHPKEIHLCIAIVAYKTKLRRPRRGLATAYVSGLKPGSKLRIGIRKGVLSLPADPSTPVVCVGPGTGIAPMRAVLEARIHDGAHNNTLYFGCRSATKDQHYAEEWIRYVEQQAITYRLAASRDGPEGVKRTYVQDLIEADSKQIWQAVHGREGWVYISGSSNKMPTAVRHAIAHAAQTEGKMSKDEANAYVLAMERDGKLYEECWG